MTQLDLVCILIKAGYTKGQWGLPKALEYSTISVAFVSEAWSAWVATLPSELQQWRDIGGGKTMPFPRWEPESGDCDVIAWDFLAYLSRCMWLDAIKQHRSRGAVAAGTFFFMNPTGHCIVWFIDHEGVLHHIDPGNCKLDHLNAEQLALIFGGEYA